MPGEHIDRQFDWLFQALNDVNGSGEISRYLGNFVVCDHELLTHNLVIAVRRGKCPAETKPQFVRWCKRQIDQNADSLLPFFLAERIKEANGRLTVRDVMNISSLHGKVRKGTAAFPRVIFNGHVALVDVPGVLKVPAKADSEDPAENFLPILELLWPWTVRAGRVEKYCARKSYATGRMIPHRIALHQLFCDFVYRNVTDAPIVAKDGDLLNWCDGNLRRKGSETLLESNLVSVEQGREGDLWPLCSTSTVDPITGNPVAQVFAQPVRPKGASPDTEDWAELYRRFETLHPTRGTVVP